uniref:Histone-lysine N-methyltransferase SETDB2 n=1 Tax=Nothobranchius kadleci TaxID=1051664 RepID=A0A1A8BVD4_NOTKA
MGEPSEPPDVELAKAFWADEDVDQVFSSVFEYLEHLKRVLQRKTATDKEYVQALKLVEFLDCSSLSSHQNQESSVVQVVIGSGELLPANLPDQDPASPSSPVSPFCLFNGLGVSATAPADRDELLPPLAPVQLEYLPHQCCKDCLPSLPRMLQSTTSLSCQNPLKVPLLCGFKRLTAMPLMSTLRDAEGLEDNGDWDVMYKAPCGQSLRDFDDVMCFLSATESYDVLQVDFFTFSHFVQLDPMPGRHHSEDLSRGKESTPVELCVGDAGTRPSEFRYRKDRWPHGCFLSRGPALFRVCCDCTDGCSDAKHCACVAMTTGGRGYSHQRLLEPVPSGLYECGPWCGCVRSRCQNRLVQRGLRVRLQVFQTEDRGWGVRCRDDLDRGTFVCIYAGVVLQRVQSPVELPPAKLFAVDVPSDDEVEVVTEWLAPPILDGRSNLVETPPPSSALTSPPLHVPVIQRPAESNTPPQNQSPTALTEGPDQKSPSAADMPKGTVAMTTETQEVSSTKPNAQRSLKRGAEMEEVCFIDANKEGNVSRFINHNCKPNLFIQNVFTDSHDPAFPVIAFFTSRVVKSGTELTWDYAADAYADPGQKQEVPCLCGSSDCRQWLHI